MKDLKRVGISEATTGIPVFIPVVSWYVGGYILTSSMINYLKGRPPAL